MSRSKSYGFFFERHYQVRWELVEGKPVVFINFGAIPIQSFPYGAERTSLQQAAQFTLQANEPVPEAEVILIDKDDRFWKNQIKPEVIHG